MPDPANVLGLAQKRRKVAGAVQQSGRLSTILSDAGREKLGG